MLALFIFDSILICVLFDPENEKAKAKSQLPRIILQKQCAILAILCLFRLLVLFPVSPFASAERQPQICTENLAKVEVSTQFP
jgi:hypothetical protein